MLREVVGQVRQVDGCTRTQHPEANPHIYSQLLFEVSARERVGFSPNGAGTTGNAHAKTEDGLLTHGAYKS